MYQNGNEKLNLNDLKYSANVLNCVYKKNTADRELVILETQKQFPQ
jgi:hypothetical protein